LDRIFWITFAFCKSGAGGQNRKWDSNSIAAILLPVATVRAVFPHTATPSIRSVRPFAPPCFHGFFATTVSQTSCITSAGISHILLIFSLLNYEMMQDLPELPNIPNVLIPTLIIPGEFLKGFRRSGTSPINQEPPQVRLRFGLKTRIG